MVKNDWNIKRGMAKPALKIFQPDVVKIEELYLGFGDPVHPDSEKVESRKLLGCFFKWTRLEAVGYMETDDG